MNGLLTLGEAAARLSCSVATVKRRVAAGDLPAFHDGRLVRVRTRRDAQAEKAA